MAFPYRSKRMRFKPATVSRLPFGSKWVPVSKAARYYNVSTQTIRHWYLADKIRVVKYKGTLWVETSNIGRLKS